LVNIYNKKSKFNNATGTNAKANVNNNVISGDATDNVEIKTIVSNDTGNNEDKPQY